MFTPSFCGLFVWVFFSLFLFHYFQCIHEKKKELKKPCVLGSKWINQVHDLEQGAGKSLSEHHLSWPCW